MKVSALKFAFGVSLLAHGATLAAIHLLSYRSVPATPALLVDQMLEIGAGLPDGATAPADALPMQPERVVATVPVPETRATVSSETEVTLFRDAPDIFAVVAVEETALPELSLPNVSVPAAAIAAVGPVQPEAVRENPAALTGEVRTGPGYLVNPKPLYPDPARRRREQGMVTLILWVDAEGLPQHVRIGRSSGFDLLDEAALAAVSRWKFIPSRIDSVAVGSEVEIPVCFRLSPGVASVR
jgi:periplasmic protein TonB